MKILQAPSNVCNIGWAMREGLRELGHEVQVWNHGASPNNFPVDRVFDVDKDPRDYVECFRQALAQDFDVYHFHGTRSLIAGRGPLPNFWDLPVLKSLGKRIVFTFHGSDVRLRSLDIDDKWSFHNFAEIPCDEARIAERLAVVRTYADHLTVGNVLNQRYVPGSVYVPKPLNLPAYAHTGIARGRRPVVLHATRRRETKGSDFIIDAVARLKARGHDFDFMLVEGVSYQRLMECVAQADIVIEKVLSGDAGVLALEALAMGKVTLSRIRPEVYRAHPEMPIIDVNPETVEAALASILDDHERRHEVARRGRPYVEANHSPRAVALQLEKLYRTPSPRKPTMYTKWKEGSVPPA